MPKEFPKLITSNTQINFTIDQFGLYAVSILAYCQKGNDLKLKIDNLEFREIPPEKNNQTYDIPPAWNGTNLKGLKKTIIFLLQLDAGQHTIAFFPKNQATIEEWSYRHVENSTNVKFDIEQQAEDGDKRPWFSFVLINLPLQSIKAEVSTAWHWFDGDDVKLIIDNKVEQNTNSKLWQYWVWHASPWQILSGSKREQKIFTKNLPQAVHYVEFWADKTPTLRQVAFDLGDFEMKRIPTKDNPKWTGDFNDDTEVMILARLIFGEARNQSKETMTGIAWVVKNRLSAHRVYFGSSYHEIILKNNGKYYQFSPLDPEEKDNFPLLIDPLKKKNKITQQAWSNSYDIALSAINGTSNDPTGGSTFFHSSDFSREKFVTKIVPGAIFAKQIGDFLFYKEPNK